MDPIRSTVEIDRSPSEVYAYLIDVSTMPEWAAPIGTKWHLTREDTVGSGAGVRFAVKQRFQRFPWMDLTVREAVPGRRVVYAGRGFKFNRVRLVLALELEPAERGATKVSLRYESERKLPTDRAFDRKGYFKRGWRKSLKRLEKVLEGDGGGGERATVAGGPRKPATGASALAADVALAE